MTVTLTQLYKSLVKQVGEEAAENMTTFIREDIKEEFEVRQEIFPTKEDLAKTELRFTERISESELRLTQRLDSHFKWLIGILVVLIGLAVTIIKWK